MKFIIYVLTGKSEKSELVFLYGQKQNRLSYTRVDFLSGFPIPWKNSDPEGNKSRGLRENPWDKNPEIKKNFRRVRG